MGHDCGVASSLWVRKLWVLGAGLIAAAIGTVFFVIGLDAADKVSSGAGLFVGLAGLAVAVYGVVLARSPAPSPASGTTSPPSETALPATASASGPAPQTAAAGERSVAVGGDNSGTIVTGDGNDVR